jgi:penicillin-binding protein 1A
VLYQTSADQRARQAIDPGVAYIMAQTMADDNNRSLIFGPNSLLHWSNHIIAAKTGTTDNFKDAVLVAFMPYLVAGLWVGDILGNNHYMFQGSDSVFVAAPGMHTFMNAVLAGIPGNVWYTKPPDVVAGPSNSWYLSDTTNIPRLPGDNPPSPTPNPVIVTVPPDPGTGPVPASPSPLPTPSP